MTNFSDENVDRKVYTIPSMRSAVLNLDIYTLILVQVLVYAGSLGFSLVLFFTRTTFPGAKQWLCGQGLLALGIIGVAAQSFGFPYVTLAFANTALLGSSILLGHGLWRFRSNRPFPLAVYALLPLALILWFLFEDRAVVSRIIIFSGFLTLISAWDASIVLRKPKPGYETASFLTAAYFILVSLGSALRAGSAFFGDTPINIYEEGRMSAAMYLLAILAAFFNLFGYFIMSAVRSEMDLKAANTAVRERNKSLLQVVSMKDSLISVLGHDLRAPISSAARYTRHQLLEYPGDLNEKRESVETLAQGLEHASSLLENLVQWARSASGKLELNPEPASLASLCSQAMVDVAAMATAKSLAIVPPDGDLHVLADPRAAVTVLRNLLSNAIKYSQPGGSIRMGIQRTRLGYASVTVDDEGVGLKPDQIQRMFQPGRTILTLGTNGEQGTGLGLAMCKSFMETMGGTLNALSLPDKGARFTAEFPIAETSTGDQA